VEPCFGTCMIRISNNILINGVYDILLQWELFYEDFDQYECTSYVCYALYIPVIFIAFGRKNDVIGAPNDTICAKALLCQCNTYRGIGAKRL